MGLVPTGITSVKAADTAVDTECYNSPAPLALAHAVVTNVKSSADLVALKRDERVAVVTAENVDELIFDTNRAGAHALILSAENATLENVRYIQARNVTVWATANSELDIYKVLQSGAYGIISYSAAKTCEVFTTATDGKTVEMKYFKN